MNPTLLPDVSAIILSSGLSERMGQPKALLKWNHETTFIEKIIGEFHRFGCQQVVCMINTAIETACSTLDVSSNVKFVVNHHPEWGRFHSIRIGLGTLKGTDFCFIHNVDNPFVNRDIVEKLYLLRDGNSWCSPMYNGKGGHPVLYTRQIAESILGIHYLNTTLADVLNQYPRVSVAMDDDSIHRNINTLEDYKRFVG